MEVSLIGRRKYNLLFQAADPVCGVLGGGRIQVSFLTKKNPAEPFYPTVPRDLNI